MLHRLAACDAGVAERAEEIASALAEQYEEQQIETARTADRGPEPTFMSVADTHNPEADPAMPQMVEVPADDGQGLDSRSDREPPPSQHAANDDAEPTRAKVKSIASYLD